MSNNQPKPRSWIIDGDPFVVDDDATLEHALGEVITILSRIGGAVTILANREQIAPEHWHTTSYVLRWNSFAPARRLEPVSEPEPVDDAA
jgi:hypothetical protein